MRAFNEQMRELAERSQGDMVAARSEQAPSSER